MANPENRSSRVEHTPATMRTAALAFSPEKSHACCVARWKGG